MADNNNNQMSIELKPEVAAGTYSNLAIISHSHSEFVMDFAAMLPGMPKAQVLNRVVMTPEHAKRLLAALNDNIMKYEQQFGRIELPGQPNTFNLSDLTPNGAKS